MPFDNVMLNHFKELAIGEPRLSPCVTSDVAPTAPIANMSEKAAVTDLESEEHNQEASPEDDDDTASISTTDSDLALPLRPIDPVTGKWKVREGSQPVLYLPFEEAGYWNVHGHAPPGVTRTHDLDNNDLKIFEAYYCAATEEDWKRFHPEIRLPANEGLFWLQHGRLPPGSTRTHDLDGKLLILSPACSASVSEQVGAAMSVPQ